MSGWELTAHACMHCGGRVLQGGDSFRCANCRAVTMGHPSGICGCGIHPGRTSWSDPSRGSSKAGRFRCVANPDVSPASPAEIVIEFFEANVRTAA